MVGDLGLFLFLAYFHGSLRNLQTPPNVPGVDTDFSRDELQAFIVKAISALGQTARQDGLDLVGCVGLVDQAVFADTRADLVVHALG